MSTPPESGRKRANPERVEYLMVEKKGTTRLQKLDLKIQIPWVHFVFMKIAEPRVIRMMHFGIYICMMIAGIGVIVRRPDHFESVVGITLLFIFGIFVALGALISAVAVLPGVWWLERVGIIMLTTGMGMYVVIICALGTTPVGVAVAIALTLTFGQRWVEIKGAQLAPREG